MKKKTLLSFILLALCAGKIFAAKDLYLAYSDSIAPITNQSKIATVFFDNDAPMKYADYKIGYVRVDGVNVSEENMRHTEFKGKYSLDGNMVLDLLPGKHTLSFVITTKESEIINGGYRNAPSPLLHTYDFIPVTLDINVEAGHFYFTKHHYKTRMTGGLLVFNLLYDKSSFLKCDDVVEKDKIKEKIITARNKSAQVDKAWQPAVKKPFAVQVSEKTANCGLEVMAMDYPCRLTWQQALEQCPEGWRLPTQKELFCMYKSKDLIGGFGGQAYLYNTVDFMKKQMKEQERANNIVNMTGSMERFTGDIFNQEDRNRYIVYSDVTIKDKEKESNAIGRYDIALVMVFDDGTIEARSMYDLYSVRYVRGEMQEEEPETPEGIYFVKKGIKVITNDLPEECRWRNAQALCYSKGYRLPALSELQAFSKDRTFRKTNLKYDEYWSSDMSISVKNNGKENDDNDNNETHHSVICVKDVPVTSLAEYGIEILNRDMPAVNWRDAQTVCGDDWRLPTGEEIKYICERKETIPNFEEESSYWTNVNMTVLTANDCKFEKEKDMEDTHSVRCVRTTFDLIGNMPSQKISQCGIEIKNQDLPITYNWRNASTACGEGWRLPTEEELKCMCENKSVIPNFNPDEAYWSNKEGKEFMGKATSISITTNDCKSEMKLAGRELLVRCVKK